MLALRYSELRPEHLKIYYNKTLANIPIWFKFTGRGFVCICCAKFMLIVPASGICH